MWDETLIESNGVGRQGEKLLFWPLAGLIHGLAVMVLVGVSYWHVEAVEEAKPVAVVLVPKDVPPAELGDGGKATKGNKRPDVKQEDTNDVIPENIPVSEKQSSDNARTGEDQQEGNAAGGVPRGIPEGIGTGEIPLFGIGQMREESPIEITAEMQKPVLIKKVEPEYPPLAIRLRIQGVVRLEAVITRAGTVKELRLINSAHPLLTKAAIDAVQQWQYKPAMRNGQPVKVYFTVTVQFFLT